MTTSTAKPVIINLRPDQKQLYWQAVEIMERTMIDKWKQVSNLYAELRYVPRTRVALDGNKVVGGLIWRFASGDRAFEIYSMAVDPTLHGRDIGTLLVSHFEEYARQCVQRGAGVESIVLDAQRDNWRFYHKLGFNFTGQVVDPDMTPGPLEMRKPLILSSSN